METSVSPKCQGHSSGETTHLHHTCYCYMDLWFMASNEHRRGTSGMTVILDPLPLPYLGPQFSHVHLEPEGGDDLLSLKCLGGC